MKKWNPRGDAGSCNTPNNCNTIMAGVEVTAYGWVTRFIME